MPTRQELPDQNNNLVRSSPPTRHNNTVKLLKNINKTVINNVLLIKPAYKDSYYQYTDLSAGLGYIAHALDRAGIENHFVDMGVNTNISFLFDEIKKLKPDMIGISMMSYRFKDTYKLIGEIKKSFSNIMIVAGGPHISMFRNETLHDCSELDFGVVLEGDETIVDLCNNIDYPYKVKGLIYRHDNEVLYTGDREYIRDLDDIGFPKYRDFNIGTYDFITIVTSRGCPYKCTFCPVLYTIGTKFRYRSAESVVEEVEYWYKKGLRKFEFGDDNFTLKRSRVYEICDLLITKNLAGIEIGLGNGIRADRVNVDMLRRMKEAGFSYVAFGVEGGNDKMLTLLRKGESMSQIEKGVKAAVDAGFPVHLFFLLGAPGETEEDVKDSVKFALKYPVVDVRFYNILPFPTTELYSYLEEHDLFIRDPREHLQDSSHWFFKPVFETPELSEKDRIRLLKWSNKVTRRHTNIVLRDIRVSKMNKKGVPYPLAFLLAEIWMRQPIINQRKVFSVIFRKLRIIEPIKKIIGIDASNEAQTRSNIV